MRAFYFGCWGEPGHYLWHQGRDGTPIKLYDQGASERQLLGVSAHSSNPRPGEIPWGYGLDGGLLQNKKTGQGEAVVEKRDGWTAVSFWDYSVDSRGGSSSTFVFDEELDPVAALEAAREAFPPVFARFNFPVVLQEHHVKITLPMITWQGEDGRPYRAECTCGWLSKIVWTEERAENLGRYHVEG